MFSLGKLKRQSVEIIIQQENYRDIALHVYVDFRQSENFLFITTIFRSFASRDATNYPDKSYY